MKRLGRTKEAEKRPNIKYISSYVIVNEQKKKSMC